jgi:hypothetical protein
MNDAPILDQVEGQYEKFLLLVLRKYKPNGVVITMADLEAVSRDQDAGDPWVLFTHGHRDSIEFKAIRTSEAKRIVEHEKATNKGRA